jgi:acetyl-CoA synthetase
VVNVSGHRLSTAEIEAALLEHHSIAEAAVVGVADELTGQAVNAFVALKEGNEASDALRKEFVMQVRKSIGPFAAPKAVHVVPDLPKTRSGKIMRRILRKILAGEEDQLGDITTVSLFQARGGLNPARLTLALVIRSFNCRENYRYCSRRKEEIGGVGV